MSRRLIFFFAAVVVMLYFSIILFMLSPLHSNRNGFYGGGYHFSFPRYEQVNWCINLKLRAPPGDVVALASFPGSGNTWLRYLLQQATGVVTGSIYMDYGLKMHGFPAENVTDGTVLVVKTHEAPPIEANKYKSAVVLIRNPRDALLADFNRLHKGHVGTAPKLAFLTKSHGRKITDWVNYVSTQLTLWESLHHLWLTRFPGPVHIVFYEVLVQDTRNTLRGILDFLNVNVTESAMDCAMSRKEGIYRRKRKQDFEPFTSDMYKSLESVRNRVLKMVMDYKKKHSNIT